MIIGAIESHGRGIPRRIDALAALVRQRGRRVRRSRDLDARLGHAGHTEIAVQIVPHPPAERRIARAGGGQRLEHRCDRYRPRQHGVATEHQYALDLTFDFGRQVQRQVGTGAARQRSSAAQQEDDARGNRRDRSGSRPAAWPVTL